MLPLTDKKRPTVNLADSEKAERQINLPGTYQVSETREARGPLQIKHSAAPEQHCAVEGVAKDIRQKRHVGSFVVYQCLGLELGEIINFSPSATTIYKLS